MSTSAKTPSADRSAGGPGSSHQDATQPNAPHRQGAAPEATKSTHHSGVSGGGGEQDIHHTHTDKRS